MVLQDPAALAETIKNALEKQGLLSDLKAQLRAKVVSVLEKDIPHPVKQRTETGTVSFLKNRTKGYRYHL
jgi:hypothetical protein